MYHLLKAIVSFVFRFCFQKIIIIDRDKIPKDKACLVVCNHPSGFLEPCVLACYVGVPLYFLVRGDIFENRILRWLLERTHQIPIFRFRDGMSAMKKNKDSIHFVINVLKKKKHLLIFAEGSTKQVRYIRPLQKGTAKIAYEVLKENPEMELDIVPIGMTLTKPANFRGQVIVKVGDPIDARAYYDGFMESPPQTIRQLTKDIKDRMVDLVPHIENKNNSGILDQVLEMHPRFERPKSAFPIVIYHDIGVFSVIDQASQYVQTLEDSSEELSNNIHKIEPYLSAEVSNKSADMIKIVLLFIPALIGFVLCGIPAFLAKRFSDSKVKEVEFYTSIWLAASLGFYFIYFIIVLIFFLFFFGKIGLLYILILPILGMISIHWLDSWRRLMKRRGYDKLSVVEQNTLIEAKSSLMNKIYKV